MGAKKRSKLNNLVSIIIPAFKQEKTITRDLKRIERALKQIRHKFEVLVVVDGFVDKTFENAKKLTSKYIKVIGYKENRGKGYAIRYGMVRAAGSIIGFLDAGMDLNPNGLSMLLEHFEWYDADIIVGSKRHPVSKVDYPLDRTVISFLSQWYIRTMFGLNVRDTQVGMKFFRKEVIGDVIPRLLVKQFAFDIELLVVAYHLGHRRIFEAPVEVRHTFKGSIVSQNLIPILLRTFWDTLAIFYRLRILRYYDNKSKQKWKFDPDLNVKVNIG